MRQFTQLRPGFWTGVTGKEIRKLGLECQIVALYLISAPNANALGLYYLPLPTAAHETGLTIEKVRKSLERLRAIGFCEYDVKSEFVFVVNMARFQIGEQLGSKDKQVPWIWRELQKLQGKCPFFQQFLARYGERYHVAACLPSEGSSKPPPSIETESGNLERELKTETRDGEGEGVERGRQLRDGTKNMHLVENDSLRPDMETMRAQRVLENRRAMSRGKS